MAAHTRGPRKRTRKPRVAAAAPRRAATAESSPPAAKRANGRSRGEPPKAPWHPLPLSEILIFAGAVAVAIAVIGRPSSGGALVLVGLAAVALGTVEVSWREHRCGYRPHALLLAILPVIALHTAVVLAVSAFTPPPRALTIGFLAVDAALAWFLFRALRLSFSQARRNRG